MRFDPSSGKFMRGGARDGAQAGAGIEQRGLGETLAWLANWNGRDQGNGILRDPYGLSPWVQRAVKHIAGPISQVELRFYESRPKGRRKGEVELIDATLEGFWDRPAEGCGKTARGMRRRMSRVDTMEATVSWLSMSGEFFWLLDDTWLTKGPVKNPFVVARPDRMQEVLDDGDLIGWQFTDGRGRRHNLLAEQVIHSGFWNPHNTHRGAAPAATAMQAATSDYAAGKFWKALAESNGDQGMTIIAPNGISEEQAEQIKLMLRRKRQAAKKGDYLPTFLVGDLKTEEPRIQSPDASAVSQRMTNRHEVFVAFGVPPSFAEITASYSVGSASDRYKLIEETCMPIAAKIAEAVEEVSSLLLGRDISAEFDFSDHSTMQSVRAERFATAKSLHERGLPWDVISDHLSLGLPSFPGSEKAYLPFALQEVAATSPSVADDSVAPSADDSAKAAIDELEVLLRGCSAHPSREVRATPNKRWEMVMRRRAPWVRKLRAGIDRALYAARVETLKNIAEAAEQEKQIRAGAFDFIFDIGDFLELLLRPFFKNMLGSYDAARAELAKYELGDVDLGDDDSPIIPADEAALEILRNRENYLKDAGVDIWNEVRDNLEEGISEGESYEKLSNRVREKFNGISKERSMRIAVTETGIAQEMGRHDAMLHAGAEWKEWLTSGDERVRVSHDALNGKKVPMDEPFLVGGYDLMFPCDPEGPPSEIINCRCIHGPVAGPPPITEPEVPVDIPY